MLRLKVQYKSMSRIVIVMSTYSTYNSKGHSNSSNATTRHSIKDQLIKIGVRKCMLAEECSSFVKPVVFC